MADIKGINPSIVQYQIHLRKKSKLIRDPQRRFNPAIKEIVQKEILKLLDNEIIYPISDSSWTSPIQVVLKKLGIIVVQNESNELMPIRVQTG